MRLFGLIGFTALIMSLVACEQNSQRKNINEIPENWKALDEPNYLIYYPDSFDLDKTGQNGKSFVLYSKQTSVQDFFRENISLTIQDLTGYNLNLDQYVKLTESQLDSVASYGKIVQSKRKKGNNNEEYHQTIYTGEQGQWNLKWLQYYWVIDQKAFVLTLTCEIHQFDNYYPIGMQIMNTFRIK